MSLETLRPLQQVESPKPTEAITPRETTEIKARTALTEMVERANTYFNDGKKSLASLRSNPGADKVLIAQAEEEIGQNNVEAGELFSDTLKELEGVTTESNVEVAEYDAETAYAQVFEQIKNIFKEEASALLAQISPDDAKNLMNEIRNSLDGEIVSLIMETVKKEPDKLQGSPQDSAQLKTLYDNFTKNLSSRFSSELDSQSILGTTNDPEIAKASHSALYKAERKTASNKLNLVSLVRKVIDAKVREVRENSQAQAAEAPALEPVNEDSQKKTASESLEAEKSGEDENTDKWESLDWKKESLNNMCVNMLKTTQRNEWMGGKEGAVSALFEAVNAYAEKAGIDPIDPRQFQSLELHFFTDPTVSKLAGTEVERVTLRFNDPKELQNFWKLLNKDKPSADMEVGGFQIPGSYFKDNDTIYGNLTGVIVSSSNESYTRHETLHSLDPNGGRRSNENRILEEVLTYMLDSGEPNSEDESRWQEIVNRVGTEDYYVHHCPDKKISLEQYQDLVGRVVDKLKATVAGDWVAPARKLAESQTIEEFLS